MAAAVLLRATSDRPVMSLVLVLKVRVVTGERGLGRSELALGDAASPRCCRAACWPDAPGWLMLKVRGSGPEAGMSGRVVTVNEVLDGHAVLDIECLDRVYLNAYVPILQSSGQVVAFMTQHLGLPIPSPALMEKIGTRFRAAVASFAEANHIPLVRFRKEDRKADVMAPYLGRQAATGRSGVAAIGVAQEFQRVWTAYQRETSTAAPQFTFATADR